MNGLPALILRPPMKALVYNMSPARWILTWTASRFSASACHGLLSGLRLVDREPPPLPGPQWVRLKTLLGGICGTDLALIALRQHPATMLQAFARFPCVLGHENVACIDQLGAQVSGWRVGQRVCVEPALGCASRGIDPPCPQCAAGRTSLCEQPADSSLPPRALLGLNNLTGGSWGEYFVAHSSQLHAVPDAIGDEQAVLLDPIASAAHAVLRRRPKEGETVLVHGAGIIALGILAAIRALKLQNTVTVLVRHDFQARLATVLGATHVLRMPRSAGPVERYDRIAQHVSGKRIAARFGNQTFLGGFDLVYDCTGSGSGMTDAFKWARSRGTVVLVGTSGITLLDTTPLWFDELEVIGANGRQLEDLDGQQRHSYDLVLDWIASGRLDLSAIPVTCFRLPEYRRALGQLLRRDRFPIIKAAFDFRAESRTLPDD